MKTILIMTAYILTVTMTLQLFPSSALAEEPKPVITRHQAKAEMEPTREIPMVKDTKINWWWVALGVGAIGGAAAALGGGGGGGSSATPVALSTGGGKVSW